MKQVSSFIPPKVSVLPTAGTAGRVVFLTTDGKFYGDNGAAWEILSRTYKVYTALVTQTGTSAPVATVLENTLGETPVWSRVGAGDYRLTLSGAFTANKTWFAQTLYSMETDDPQSVTVDVLRIDANSLNIVSRNFGVPVEYSDYIGASVSLEVRVYY